MISVMAKARFINRPRRRHLILIIIFILTIYVVVPQIGAFKSSWSKLGNLNITWVLTCIIFTGLTYLFAAGMYYWLAFKRLSYWRTVIFQLAAMFINRLLPAGVGALGANYLYLKHSNHTDGQAAAAISVNNLLGFMGHAAILGLLLLIFRQPLNLNGNLRLPGIISPQAAAVLAVLLFVLIVGFIYSRFKRILKDVWAQFLSYRRRPSHLFAGLLCSMGLTLANLTAFYSSTAALGVNLNPAVLFIIFTLGVSLATAAPTPGGLGGFEAGLVAGLIAYHIDSSTALAIALLYRLVAYWLALASGALALIYVQKRGYI